MCTYLSARRAFLQRQTKALLLGAGRGEDSALHPGCRLKSEPQERSETAVMLRIMLEETKAQSEGRRQGSQATCPLAGLSCHLPAEVLRPLPLKTVKGQRKFWQSSAVATYLNVATVMASGRELDPAEGDGALERHLDGRLLHAILSVGPRGARDGAAAEVPLY